MKLSCIRSKTLETKFAETGLHRADSEAVMRFSFRVGRGVQRYVCDPELLSSRAFLIISVTA